MEKLKVVIHLSEEDRFQSGINNVNNLMKSGRDVDICVVLNGECAKHSTFDEQLKGLIDKNVEVNVCNNSLNHFKINNDEIMSGISIVSAGIIELIEKQQAGYAYIKP